MKAIKFKAIAIVGSILFFSGCSFSQELKGIGQTEKTSSPQNGGYLDQMDGIAQQTKQNVQSTEQKYIEKVNGDAQKKQEAAAQAKSSQAVSSQPTQNPSPSNLQNNQTNNMDNSELVKKYSAAVLKTNFGDIKVKFYNADSPITVGNFLKLSQDGFYNGTKFHRVIKDFMIQGGDPNSKDSDWSNDGQGGPGYTFADEFNAHKLVKGSLAMANSGPNTNGSQFFIVAAAATAWLDGKHTNFGEVTEGMDVVAKIENVAKNSNDHPTEDVTIESIELLEK